MIKRITWMEEKTKADGSKYLRMRIDGGLFVGVWDEKFFPIVRDTVKRKGEADITISKKGDFYNLKAIVPVIQTLEQLKDAEKVERTDKWAPWPINQAGMFITAAQKNAVNIAIPLIQERAKSTADQAINMVNDIAQRLYKWLIQKQEEAIYLYEHEADKDEVVSEEPEEVETEVTEEMLAGDSKGNPGTETVAQTPMDTLIDGKKADVDDIPDGLKSNEQLKEAADGRLAKHSD